MEVALVLPDILGEEFGVVLHSVADADLADIASKVLYDPSPFGLPSKRGSSSSSLQSFDAQSPCPSISATPSSRHDSWFRLLRSDLAAFRSAFLTALRDARFSKTCSKSWIHALTGASNASANVGTILVLAWLSAHWTTPGVTLRALRNGRPMKRSNVEGSLARVNENCWQGPGEVIVYSDAATP